MEAQAIRYISFVPHYQARPCMNYCIDNTVSNSIESKPAQEKKPKRSDTKRIKHHKLSSVNLACSGMLDITRKDKNERVNQWIKSIALSATFP